MTWKSFFMFLAVAAVACTVIYLIFKSFWISRILSLAGCGTMIYLTVTMDLATRVEKKWTFILLSTVSFLLFRGEEAFEEHFTGFLVNYGGGWFAETAGGILENTLIALLVTGLMYYFLAPNYPYFYYIIPGIIIALDVWSIIQN